MPKITARTVAEHRDVQLSKLLAEALDIVRADGVDAVTLAELAKRTGRSRASLYAYFGSTDSLRKTLCAQASEARGSATCIGNECVVLGHTLASTFPISCALSSDAGPSVIGLPSASATYTGMVRPRSWSSDSGCGVGNCRRCMRCRRA